MASAQYGQASGLGVLVSSEGVPTTLASELVVLVATGTPPTRYTNASELVMLASSQQDNVMVEVSEVCILVSHVANASDQFNSRSWGFNLDQHQFYVLHAGVEGTFVFDILSSEWAQWQTQGYDTWNAENGIEWDGEVYYGDRDGATLWRMDPTSFLDDEFRAIQRVVTGGLPAEARSTLRSGLFVLSATKEPSVDTVSVPYVQLSISDDGGLTWYDLDQIALDTSETQDFSWRGLGTIRAPGRVFKITDEGGFVTIRGADQKILGVDDE